MPPRPPDATPPPSDDVWDPAQYQRFAAERARPIDDLLGLLEPVPGGEVVDLGCGGGELTVRLHQRIGAARTLGIDASRAMLAEAEALTSEVVEFERGDLATFHRPGRYDVVAANAALHWVGDHPSVLRRLTESLRPGGQLAVQVPANADHPAHRLADEVAHTEPFLDLLGDRPPPDPVRVNVAPPEDYAQLLWDLGYEAQHVQLRVYDQVLPSTATVVEWVRGTTLTRFKVLGPEGFDRFVAAYTERLLDVLGDRAPFFYPFKRILFWARLPR